MRERVLFDASKARYHKIIIMTDADVDALISRLCFLRSFLGK